MLKNQQPITYYQERIKMKLVTAIIKPDKVEALRKSLTGIDIQGLTILEAKGYGRQKGHTEMYRGAEYEVHFLPKSRAEVLVDDKDLEKVITTISEAVKTGKIGDGKIFITEVSDIIRIRTGERGAEAIS
jgi:nitrogen regulatory protein PII